MSYDDDTKRILSLHDQNRELRAEIERLHHSAEKDVNELRALLAEAKERIPQWTTGVNDKLLAEGEMSNEAELTETGALRFEIGHLKEEIERLQTEDATIAAVRKLAERELRLHSTDFRWRNALAALTAKQVIADLRAEIERLRALVKTLADDLEDELKGHYSGTLDYPSERRRFERDMASVYEDRCALEGK